MIGSGPSVFPLTTYQQTPACNYSPVAYVGELTVANDNVGKEDVLFGTSGMIISIPIEKNDALGLVTVEWRLFTTFSSGAVNSDAVFSIRMLPGVTNDPPYFESGPSNPVNVIPCLNNPAAKTWHHEFEPVTDPDGDEVLFVLVCPELAVDIFKTKVVDGVLSITLNPKPLFDPIPGFHDCDMSVTDTNYMLSYQINVQVDCDYSIQESDDAKSLNTVVPIP